MATADISVYRDIDPNSIYGANDRESSITFVYTRSGNWYQLPYPNNHMDLLEDDDIFDDIFYDPEYVQDWIRQFAIRREKVGRPVPRHELQRKGRHDLKTTRSEQTKHAIFGRMGKYEGDFVIALWNRLDDPLMRPFIKKLTQKFPAIKEVAATVIIVGKDQEPRYLSEFLSGEPLKKKVKTTTAAAVREIPRVDDKTYEIDGKHYTKNDLADLLKSVHTSAWRWPEIRGVLCHPDMRKYPELINYIPNRCTPTDIKGKPKWSDWLRAAGATYSYEQKLSFKGWLITEGLFDDSRVHRHSQREDAPRNLRRNARLRENASI